MKQLSIIIFLIVSAPSNLLTAQVDTLETFGFADGIPLGWTTIDSTGNGFEWIHTYSGLEAIYNPQSASDLNSTSNEDGWLMMHAAYYNTDTIGGLSEVDSLISMNSVITSSPMDFSAESEVFLKLEHYFRTLSNPTWGSLELGLSSDNENWTIYDLHTGFDSPLNTEDGVETITLNITAEAAFQEEVWIRFHFRNLAWHFWCIDDLIFTDQDITSDVGSILEGEASTTVFPNPTSDFISIKNNNEDFDILSLDGKLIYSGYNAQDVIDLRPFEKGVYIIRFKESGKNLKVVKK